MPGDLPELFQAIGRGLLAGALIVSPVLLWRWWRGKELFPGAKVPVTSLPSWFLVFSGLLFSACAVYSGAQGRLSFAVAFGLAASVYFIGLVYKVVAKRRSIG